MKIFLSGEVQTNWRDEIIKTFKEHEFYNPKVKNYSAKDKKAERQAIKESDLVIVKKKRMGKGTRREIGLCKKINKPCWVYEDVEDIIEMLIEMKNQSEAK